MRRGARRELGITTFTVSPTMIGRVYTISMRVRAPDISPKHAERHQEELSGTL